jgi:nucleotidyltransferase substrate binding protein (TIGR01987 family)
MSEPGLDLSALRKAVASLERALEIVGNSPWFDVQSPDMQNILIAGVIQNFEFVYELSIKMIRRQIELGSDSPDEVDKADFRDMLRIAGETGLIYDVEAWFYHRKMRNLTAHTYDHEKARLVYQDTPTFIEDARALLAVLEANNG